MQIKRADTGDIDEIYEVLLSVSMATDLEVISTKSLKQKQKQKSREKKKLVFEGQVYLGVRKFVSAFSYLPGGGAELP